MESPLEFWFVSDNIGLGVVEIGGVLDGLAAKGSTFLITSWMARRCSFSASVSLPRRTASKVLTVRNFASFLTCCYTAYVTWSPRSTTFDFSFSGFFTFFFPFD